MGEPPAKVELTEDTMTALIERLGATLNKKIDELLTAKLEPIEARIKAHDDDIKQLKLQANPLGDEYLLKLNELEERQLANTILVHDLVEDAGASLTDNVKKLLPKLADIDIQCFRMPKSKTTKKRAIKVVINAANGHVLANEAVKANKPSYAAAGAVPTPAKPTVKRFKTKLRANADKLFYEKISELKKQKDILEFYFDKMGFQLISNHGSWTFNPTNGQLNADNPPARYTPPHVNFGGRH